jgi:O-antigen/teichoic acid export membrane protein
MERKLSFYTFFYLGSLVFMRGCGILAKVLMARSITPYEYGLITLFVIALPGTMQFITNFCFEDILGHATEGKKYFSFTLIYGTLSTVLIAMLILLFPAPFFTFLNVPEGSWTFLSLVFVGVLFAVTISGFFFGILRGKRDHTLAAAFSAAPSILRVVFIVLAIYVLGVSDFSFIVVIFALPAIVVLVPVIIIKRKTIESSLQKIVVPKKGIMVFGFSFFILSMWLPLSQHINSVIITHDLGVIWQGYFDISLSMVAVITFFSSAVYMIAAPETTVNDKSRSDIFSKRGGFGDVGKSLLSMCLLCIIILYFYSHQLTTLLFSQDYSVAGDYLIILAIGYTLLFIQQFIAFLSVSAESENGLSKLSIVTIASIIIFPFFTHFMILYYGFMGVYMATTIFILFYTLATIVLIKDRSPLFLLLSRIDRLILVAVVVFLMTYALNLSYIPGILAATILFMALIIAIGYIDKDFLLGMINFNRNKM